LVGLLQPRFTPLERVDLHARLTMAQAEIAGATASLEASKASYERLKSLNAENKTASDRALQEAEAKMKAEAAKLKAAVETSAAAARILPLGREPLVLKGDRVAPAPTDPQLLGDAAYFSVDAGDSRLRPGMAFTAWLQLPGEPAKGVVLPRSAVLRLEGERWV